MSSNTCCSALCGLERAVCGPVEVERLRGEPPNGAPRELELLPAEPRPGLPFAWFHVLSPICEWPAGSRLVLTVRDVSTWAQRFPVAVRIGWPPVARRECHVSAVCQCVTA